MDVYVQYVREETLLYIYLLYSFQLIIVGEHFYFYMKLLAFNQPQQSFNRVCSCIIVTTLLHPEEKSSAYSTRTNYLF